MLCEHCVVNCLHSVAYQLVALVGNFFSNFNSVIHCKCTVLIVCFLCQKQISDLKCLNVYFYQSLLSRAVYCVGFIGCCGRLALKHHQEQSPESPLVEFSIYIARDGVG